MAEYVAPYKSLKEGFEINVAQAIIDERNAVNGLMHTAKKMQTLAQTIVPRANAYDAAFESDIRPPLPNSLATLQGFIVFLLIVSYLVLMTVSLITVHSMYTSVKITSNVFIGYLILGLMLYTFIVRFA